MDECRSYRTRYIHKTCQELPPGKIKQGASTRAIKASSTFQNNFYEMPIHIVRHSCVSLVSWSSCCSECFVTFPLSTILTSRNRHREIESTTTMSSTLRIAKCVRRKKAHSSLQFAISMGHLLPAHDRYFTCHQSCASTLGGKVYLVSCVAAPPPYSKGPNHHCHNL